MKFRRKFLLFGVLLLVLWLVVSFLPHYTWFIYYYDRLVYYPFQSVRISLFGFIPFSLGDVLYILGGAALLATVIKWFYFITRFSSQKERLFLSLLRTVNTALAVYLLFYLGWGANYNRLPLRDTWDLHTNIDTSASVDQRKAIDLAATTAFNRFLVDRLNSTVTQYRQLPFNEINGRAKTYYIAHTNSKVKKYGLDIKPTLLGYFMERMAVEGYYNPFTGEGQVNKELPAFILPFIISHEMAHQAGIAAEGDANLMAYALGTATTDPIFQYSAYLNLWLYANNRLYRRDSVAALAFGSQLNELTQRQLDTLEEINRKYHNEMARYSTDVYDSYLKMQQQKEGIRSYGNVTTLAWLLEQKRRAGKWGPINLP